MIELALTRTGIQKISKGLPYLTKEDFFEQLPKAGQQFYVKTENKTHYGYIGKEHKSHAAMISAPFSKTEFERIFKEALAKRVQAFKVLPEAYRLIHSEADGLPGVTIEVFNEFAVITYYNEGIEKYTVDLLQALESCIQLKGIYHKYRLPGIEKPMQVNGIKAPENITINESTGAYVVKLNDGLMNGLFLDQRANRIWLAKNAYNKSICNTFSYTGSLTIACALGGAKSTVSVDLSAPYSQWCRENILVNKLNPEQHQVVTSDTFDHFNFCRRNNVKYDQIILDPPTFAKKKNGSFSVPNNYQELIIASLPLLNPKGQLICSTNFAQWSLPEFEMHIRDTANRFGYKLKVIYKAGADKDFPIHPQWPESDHLKFVALEKLN